MALKSNNQHPKNFFLIQVSFPYFLKYIDYFSFALQVHKLFHFLSLILLLQKENMFLILFHEE